MTEENNTVQPVSPTTPTVQPVSPTDGQTGISTNATVTAAFDKDMNAATIQDNFELRDASNNVVPATVTYEEGSRTARLTPNSPLDNSKTYTATLKGGVEGVKDAEDNALAQNETWSFTTAALTSPPYGLQFARWAIGAGLIAYVGTLITIMILTATLDLTGAVGSLFTVIGTVSGSLFTLIGTISGAYFGIKRSSDTEDKARDTERAANERTQDESSKKTNAAGALDPQTWRTLKDRGEL
jgi:hypothetical protein